MIANDLKFQNLCSDPFFSDLKVFKFRSECWGPIYGSDPCLSSGFQCLFTNRQSICAINPISTPHSTSLIVDSTHSARRSAKMLKSTDFPNIFSKNLHIFNKYKCAANNRHNSKCAHNVDVDKHLIISRTSTNS